MHGQSHRGVRYDTAYIYWVVEYENAVMVSVRIMVIFKFNVMVKFLVMD